MFKLDELIVNNLGLIAEAHLEPGEGFVVITGETGTGKTMLMGAVDLLLGRTAASDLVGPVADEAAVSGRLASDADAEELIASRRVLGGGRSRAYLDGEMVPARALTERLEPLMEVVKQGDARRLVDPAAFRRLVDACLDSAGRKCLSAYQDAWAELVALRTDQEALGGDTRALERELDLARYQGEEIATAGFDLGDEIELARQGDRLRHAEDLTEALAEAASNLASAESLESAVAAMRRASSFDQGLIEISDQLDALQSEWSDSLSAIRNAAEGIEHNPAALEEVGARLTLLGELKRKYGATLEEVLSYGAQAANRASELEDLLQRAGDVDRRLTEAADELAGAGEALRAARVRAGKSLAAEAIHHLKDLGFSDPTVEVEVVTVEPGPAGADQTRLLFASDSSLTSAPAHKSASGGELSRLILAVRLAAGAADASIMVFDEVDAGVGGATALAMGEKLAGLATASQVFCVTHLPQVAAFADRHYVVERQGNTASVQPVFDEDRTAELTRMMAGLGESAKGRQHAVELLETAKARRRR